MFKNKPKIEVITLNKKAITDFAAERNLLFNKSKKDWVMFIDSDEVAPDELMKEVYLKLKDPLFNKYCGYYLKRKNYFLGYYIGTDKIIRLIKKGSGNWMRRVHEVFNITRGRPGELKTPITHNTANNLHNYIKKINSYSYLHAKSNLEENKHSDLLKIIFYPLAKFIATYIKSRNVVFSIMQSFHSFLAWSELWLYQNR